ncbi:hypothetical protein [Halanaerobaculum tunisiense]
MDFLTSTLLSGVIWDGIKKGANITVDYLKKSLKDFILSEEDYKAIVNELKEAPEYATKSEKYLEAFIDDNKTINEILSNAKPINKNSINHSSFESSPIMQGGNNNRQVTYNSSSNDKNIGKDNELEDNIIFGDKKNSGIGNK